jgi:hypothetical protein
MLNDPFGKEMPIPEWHLDSSQPSQSTEYDSAQNDPLADWSRKPFHLPIFRLIQWNPSPAPAGQPLPDDSSESDGHYPVPYGELDALRFKAELETAQCELEDISKKAGIAELEWEDQRKQLLETIDGTALTPLFDPIRPLMLIFPFLALCSP